jgi:Zn-dependent protease with chaperone function
VIVTVGSVLKIRQLRPGGAVVADLLGGKRLDPHPKDLNELKLLHVVEEMSVASGTPMPDLYVLRGEFGLNAFVAGHTASDMVVVVTEGCVRYLTRDEMQGVIAHEYSHLLHGDMRLNMRLMGWVHGLFTVTLLSYWVMSKTYRERDRDVSLGGLPEFRGGLWIFLDLVVMVVGFALAFIGWNSAFFGRIIKGAVSRQREFLADAAAVQFTRNPEGLAGALKRAKQWPEGTVIHSSQAEQASHIFFCDGLEEDRFWLTSTHPPLEERIQRVESMMGRAFVPEPRPVAAGERKPAAPRAAERTPEMPAIPMTIPAALEAKTLASAARTGITTETVIASIGVPTGEHLAHAARLIAALPPPVRAATSDTATATAIVYALLLSPEPPIRDAQLGHLRETDKPETLDLVEGLRSQIQSLPRDAKLPLVELSLPAMRRLSSSGYEQFRSNVEALVNADRQIDLFEFALQKLLHLRLEPRFRAVSHPEVRYHAIAGLKCACSTLLSGLAHAGQETEDEAAAAFSRGTQSLGTAASDFRLVPEADCTLAAVEAALNNLAEAAPRVKRDLLRACAETVAADGLVRPGEAELLRAIADSLDCPIPPFLPAGRRALPAPL